MLIRVGKAQSCMATYRWNAISEGCHIGAVALRCVDDGKVITYRVAFHQWVAWRGGRRAIRFSLFNWLFREKVSAMLLSWLMVWRGLRSGDTTENWNRITGRGEYLSGRWRWTPISREAKQSNFIDEKERHTVKMKS